MITEQDAITLHFDIYKIWCHLNRLFFNINKLKYMQYCSIINPIYYQYYTFDSRTRFQIHHHYHLKAMSCRDNHYPYRLPRSLTTTIIL